MLNYPSDDATNNPHPNANKSIHNAVFARWLIHTFGQAKLREGGGCVDIAGGRGLVSFELAVRYGVKSTVIEPRAIICKAITRRMGIKVTRNRRRAHPDTSASSSSSKRKRDGDGEEILRQRPKKGLENFIDSLLPVKDDLVLLEGIDEIFDDSSGKSLPFTHLNAYFTWPLVCSSGSSDGDEISLLKPAALPFFSTSTLGVLNHPNGQGGKVSAPIASSENTRLTQALQSSSILFGVHADQATEAIVDAALALGKPFAVVPCCVFKAEHRKIKVVKKTADEMVVKKGIEEETEESRKMEDDMEEKVVSTYEELLQYLQAKHPSIQRGELPFFGRNIVLYRF